jgi:hypothetical protein
MVTTRRTRSATLLFLAVTATVAGCQRSTTVSAVNNCDTLIYVSASSVSAEEAEEREWISLTSGQRDEIAGIAQSAKTLYVDVRSGQGGEVRHFEVAIYDLAQPPADTRYDKELVLEGDRCPVTGQVPAPASRRGSRTE